MIFIVEGQPQGKARPRFSKKSGTVYTPKNTADYEKEIREAYIKAGGKKIPADCYVKIDIMAYFKIPKSYSKKKAMTCQHNINKPTVKPDVDNITKVVLDALNGVAYEDDKQVVICRCEKRYSKSGAGYVDVEISETKE
jgi:Holliday junction resolvase RusA-like endonuclease